MSFIEDAGCRSSVLRFAPQLQDLGAALSRRHCFSLRGTAGASIQLCKTRGTQVQAGNLSVKLATGLVEGSGYLDMTALKHTHTSVRLVVYMPCTLNRSILACSL